MLEFYPTMIVFPIKCPLAAGVEHLCEGDLCFKAHMPTLSQILNSPKQQCYTSQNNTFLSLSCCFPLSSSPHLFLFAISVTTPPFSFLSPLTPPPSPSIFTLHSVTHSLSLLTLPFLVLLHSFFPLLFWVPLSSSTNHATQHI